MLGLLQQLSVQRCLTALDGNTHHQPPGGGLEGNKGVFQKSSALAEGARQINIGDGIMVEDAREELLTVREVARRLRVDDTTVRRWIKSGALEAITLPHRGKRQAYRIKKSTLDQLLSSSVPVE